MSNAPKTVLAIHDLPGFGRAALSVIVPVLSCLGVQAAAAFVSECIRQTPEGTDERLGVWLEAALPKLMQQ